MSLLGLLVLQGALWGLSYLLREDEGDDDGKDDVRPTTMKDIASGSVVPVIFGRCLTRADPALIRSQAYADPDYLKTLVLVDGTCPVGLVPNSGEPEYSFGHYYLGGILAERVFPANVPGSTYPSVVFTEYDIWGGPGHGGGVHATFTKPSVIFEVPSGPVVLHSPEWTALWRATTFQFDNETARLVNFGYTNTAYLILNQFQVGEGEIIPRGGSRSLPSIEVESICIPKYPGMESLVDGYIPTNDPEGSSHIPRLHIEYGDANPASVLYCLLIDDVVGLSMDPANVDFATFVAAASVLKTEGNGISMLLEKSTSAETLIKEVLKQVDGVLYSDPLTKQLSLKLIRQDYGVAPFATLLSADPSNCSAVVDFKVSLPEDTYNQVRVKFQNRAKHYQDDEALSQDSSSVNDGRPTRSIDFTYPGVKTAALANILAARDLKRVGTPTTTVTIQVNREFAGHTPGDTILFTWPDYSIVDMVLRIIQVDSGELDNGQIILSCTQDKDAFVAPAFGEPGTRTTPRTVVQPPLSVDVFESSDVSGVGGFGVSDDLWRGRLSLLVSSQDSDETALVEWSRDQGLTYKPMIIDMYTTPTAELAVDYDHDDKNLDTTGIVILDATGDFPKGPFTGDQIAYGDNLIKIDEEILSFVSADYLGDNNYKLNNVWRGLLDTISATHRAGASVSFLSGVAPDKIITEIRPGSDGKVLFKVRMRNTRAIQPDSEASYLEVDFKRRAKSPTAPDALTLKSFAVDELTSTPDVEYAYDTSDNSAVSNRLLLGHLRETVEPGYVAKSNDHQASWRRRNSNPTTIVTVSALDTAPHTEEQISYRLEGKLDTEDVWEVIDDTAYGNSHKGTGKITKKEGYLSLEKLLPGINNIRMCAVRSDEQTGEELCSIDIHDQTIDVLPQRQLLTNGKLAPYWDIEAQSSGAVYGDAKLVLGAATSARGWISTGPLNVLFGVFTAPLQQGDDTKGFAYWSDEASSTLYATIEQIVKIPLASDDAVNQTDSEVELVFYFYLDGAAFYSVTIEAVSEDGTVISTTTSTDVVVIIDTGWSKRVHTLAVTAEASSLRVILSTRKTSKGTNCAIADVQLRMAPEISSQQLLNTTFVTNFASWTTTGTWLHASSALGINQLTSDNGGTNLSDMIYCTVDAGGGAATLEQDVALPGAFGDGDYVHVEFWAARLNNSTKNTFRFIIWCKDGGVGIASFESADMYINTEDTWSRYEGLLRIPPNCTHVGVQFIMILDDTATIDIALDGISMKLYKSDQRPVVLDYSIPTTQTTPSTAMQFASACGDPRVLPLHIFEFNEARGESHTDSIQGVAFDTVVGVDGTDVVQGESSTSPWNGTTFSDQCLALNTVLGGVKSTDQDFLDPKNRSLAIYLRYKMSDFGQSGTSNILSKISSNPSPVNGAGFQIYYDAVTSRLNIYMASNKTGETTFSATAYLELSVLDNATHWACFKIDLDSATLSCFGDTGVGTAVDINDLILNGNDFSNQSDEVFIGYNDTLGGLFSGGFSAPMQLSYMAVLVGPSVRRFTKTVADKLWTRDDDFNTLYPLQYFRDAELILPVSDTEAMSFPGGLGVAGADATPAISYWDSLSDTNKLALSCPKATRNWITYAEDFSNAAWLKSDIVEVSGERSPLGLATAQAIAQYNVGGYVQNVVSGLVVNDYYTFSLYLEPYAAFTPPLSETIFDAPAVQEFPATAVAFAALVGAPAALPSSILRMEGISGNLVDELGVLDLTPVSAPLQGQKAIGFYNGLDLISKGAVESSVVGADFEESDNTVYDFTTGSFAQTIVFRVKKSDTDQYLFQKRSGNGYYIRVFAGTGNLSILVVDSGGGTFGTVSGNHADGAWHCLIVGQHQGTNNLHVHSDLGSSITSVTLGNISNIDVFTYLRSAPDSQMAYASVLVGVAAEALLDLGAAAITNFWKHATDPTGDMVSTGRASALSIPIDADGSICHFALNTVSIGYSAALTSVRQFGLFCNKIITNLVTDSESIENWIDSDISYTERDVDAPDGFRNATKITASADNGYASNLMVTAATTTYTESIYLWNADSGDTSGKVIFYDETGSVEIGSQEFTTTTKYQRITLTATSMIGQTSSSFRVSIDISGKSIHLWGAQCEVGDTATSYVRALGAATSSASSTYSTSAITTPALGEIKTTFVEIKRDSNAFVYNFVASGNSNRRTMTTQPATISTLIYADNSSTEVSVVAPVAFDPNIEHTNRSVWDQSVAGDNTSGREAILIVDGVTTLPAQLSPWDYPVPVLGELPGTLLLGSNSGSFATDIIFQSISSYNKLSTAQGATIHSIQIDLLRSDLSTVLATFTRPAIAGWTRVKVATQALDTSIAVRVYGGTSATDDEACRAWGLMLHDHELAGGYPIVLNNDAVLNESPPTYQYILGMSENLLCNADEGRIEAILAPPLRTAGGVTSPIIRLVGGPGDHDRRELSAIHAAGDGATFTYDLQLNNGDATAAGTYGTLAENENVESVVNIAWRGKSQLRISGDYVDFNVDGAPAPIGATTAIDPGDGITNLTLGSNEDVSEYYDGGIQKVTLYGNGTPVIPSPATPATARVWAKTVGEFVAAFPTIPKPSSLYTFQRESDLILDIVSNKNLVGGGFAGTTVPTFGVAAEDGRTGVLMDSIFDALVIPDVNSYNLDGNTDMTYWFRVYLPAFTSTNFGVFSRRGDSSLSFPGFSIYINSSNYLVTVQDGGPLTASTFTLSIDHSLQYVDIAYVVDRSGNNEGRLETTLGTEVGSLSAVESLYTDVPFVLGRSKEEGRSAFVGEIFTYGGIWNGTALTRAQLLEIWTPQ